MGKFVTKWVVWESHTHLMNSWLKPLVILCGLFCALSLGVLGWLTVQTTEVVDARDGSLSPNWPQKKKAADSGGGSSTVMIAASNEMQVEDLAKKLDELNRAPGLVPSELLLTLDSPAALAAFLKRAAEAGFEVLYSDPRLLSARVRYGDAEAMARELRNNAEDYDNIGLNYLAWVPGLPDTERQTDTANAGGTQPFGTSGLEAINASGDRSNWGKGITAAVLDTGITDHSSLSHTQVNHYDLVKDGEALNGHGTAMASLIAGNDATNGGVAPITKLIDIRVADSKGKSNTALVAQGILQAVDQGAAIINISLGSTGDSVVLRNAVEYAQSRGVIIVAAAGNEQQTSLAYPAGYAGVISVAAIDANGTQAYFSNSGSSLTISAPGVGIVSAYDDNRMVISSGTSQATALTTGVVSTMLSRGYAPQNIAQTLQDNALPISAPKEQVGAGLVQVPRL